MGKRSDFKRIERDFYPTPEMAVLPLKNILGKIDTFCEPCAGNRQLINIIEQYGPRCTSAFDIEPQVDGIIKKDALKISLTDINNSDMIITNPPWDRKVLHPMIEHFRTLAPTWLLFDADWMHTKQAIPYLEYCEKIVSVGRVKWIPESKMTGKDNCAWYLFKQTKVNETIFIGPQKKDKT